MDVQFGILGSLRLVVDGREVVLTSRKQRGLLGALLVDVGRVVSTDRLAEALWGAGQPEDPVGAVHTHVSRLRSLLRRHGVGDVDALLVTRPPGYTLAIHPHQVDAGRFGDLVERARTTSTPEATADLVDAAVRLWRGPPLVEFDHERARTEAARLAELRVVAQELRADALLAMGRHAEVVGALDAAVVRHPLRERLHGQLMVALARGGRQAEALALFQRLRGRLVAELGTEPARDLRRLAQAIRRQDEDLPWPVPDRGSWAPRSGTRRSRAAHEGRSGGIGSLPMPLTSFVGRKDEVRRVVAALEAARVVVLTGVGGVGKSRLAVRVARERAGDYPDGVDLCDLVGADESGAVPDVVSTTLGIVHADDGDSQDALVDSLRAQRRLLVLDNCEHVLAGASELVDRIARTCPKVDVLATSRQPLGVAGAQVWPVRPLHVGERPDGAAVTLFRDRALTADPTFELGDADHAVVTEICRRLDGLPLAIELAAARIRSMTPADIGARLDDRFQLLTGTARVTSARHRSLQDVVDWSYELLQDPTRRLFERLAVFAGGFELATAERVCAGDDVPANELSRHLAELVDHSLVTVDRSGRHARYRLLETLRAHGRAQLVERGELATWQRRHAAHFTALCEQAARGMLGPDEAHWVAVLDREFANVRAAHSWARGADEVDLALRLPAALQEWAYLGQHDEVYDWALRTLDLPSAARRPAYTAALVITGVGWMQRGRLEQARTVGDDVVMTATDEQAVLRAHRLLAEVSLYQGRLDETDRHGRDVVERARAAERPYEEALGILYRVFAALYAGQGAQARELLDTGWRVAERVGAPTLGAGFSLLEGELSLDVHPETALDAFHEAIETARSVGNRFIGGVARVGVAALEARHGQPDRALTAFREIVEHWRRCGDWVHMWTTLRNLVVLLERLEADRPAAVLLGAIATASTGAEAFGVDAQRMKATADSLRGSLAEQTFVGAEARGRRMGDDEAITHALAAIDRLLADEPTGAG